MQAGDLGVIEETAARANVGVDETRVGRILPPMGELVAVGIEDRIETKGLDLISLPIRRRASEVTRLSAVMRLGVRGAACCAPTRIVTVDLA